jgi:hypothetical protein
MITVSGSGFMTHCFRPHSDLGPPDWKLEAPGGVSLLWWADFFEISQLRSQDTFSVIKPQNYKKQTLTMRLPYVNDPPGFTDPEDKEIEARVRQRRGTRGLIPLDRALLHSPPVADGWYVVLP